MNQLFCSLLQTMEEHYHTQDVPNLISRLESEIPHKRKRVHDILFFVLAVCKRNAFHTDYVDSILSYLSSHYFDYSLIQKGYLHFLQPNYIFNESSNLPSSWQERDYPSSWIALYHAIQKKDVNQCNSILLDLCKRNESNHLLLLYNLILLSTKEQFPSLVSLFLKYYHLPCSISNFPLFHPHAFPVCKDLRPFLLQNVLIKACKENSNLDLIQTLLSAAPSGDWIHLVSLIHSMNQFENIKEDFRPLQTSRTPLDQTLFHLYYLVSIPL